MSYKALVLGAMVAPVSFLSSAVQEIDLPMQNVSAKQHKKMEELAALSAKIAEKHALLRGWVEQARELVDESDHSFKEIEETLNTFVQKFQMAYSQKNVEGILANLSFANDYDVDYLKVHLVRCAFLQLEIIALVKQYEKILQEFVLLPNDN